MKRADKAWGSSARSHIVCLSPHRRRRRSCSSFDNVSRYEAGQVEFQYLLHPQYLTLPKSDNAPGHRQPWHLLGLLAKQRNPSTCSCLSPLSDCSTIYMHIQQCGNNKANLADSYSCLQLFLPASRDAGSRKHSLPGQTGNTPVELAIGRGSRGRGGALCGAGANGNRWIRYLTLLWLTQYTQFRASNDNNTGKWVFYRALLSGLSAAQSRLLLIHR